jgi:hypothetical protein
MYYKYNVKTGVKKIHAKTKATLSTTGTLLASLGMAAAIPLAAHAAASNGFNQFGYNYNARVFSGLADGSDKNIDGTVWGDSTYANDHLVMKWNKAWDDCNANGYDNPQYCAGAWVINEWSGMSAGGSQSTEHYKIIWVGSLAESSPYWVDGGYSVWGNYEVIQDQGVINGQHTSFALATPNGLGASKK